MSSSPPPTSPGKQPVIAVLVNAMAPSRVHQHARIEAALRPHSLRLLVPLLYEFNNIRWPLPDLSKFGGVLLGPGETLPERRPSLRKGIAKGRRVVDVLRHHDVRALVINGYVHVECWMAFRWAKANHVPVFLAGDSNILGEAGGQRIKRLAKRAIITPLVRACDGVMPVGSMGEKYFKRYGATPDRTFVVTLEVDPSLSEPLSPQERAAHRAWSGFTDDRKRILCSGRLKSFKRFHDAIDAFIAIADRRPEWDLVIAGDGPERASLEARVPSHLRPRVRFLGMISEPDRAMSLFKDTHLFLHPAGYEPWGMVIQEAAAAGIPVVATNVTGSAVDLVREDENGFTVPVADVGAMSNALLTVTDPSQYPRFAASAKTSLDRWHEKYESAKGFLAAMRHAGVC
jgi:glycosyltransferase involved in cell wall biosynthesis